MALPPPQGTLCGVRDWWLVVVVFLVVFVPLRSPSADPPPSPLLEDWTEWPDCPEARRWPTFCSALLNTSLLNDTAKRKVRDMIPTAKAFFCDMVRVLNKMDCAQPFTVSLRWKLGCQEAYRDWSCSLLTEGLLPVGLNSCDSTCHQVIRVCPYLSPDRVQVEATGKAALHPSQYGGHPAFHCPTTYTDSNHHHTEDYFFRRSTPSPDALVCIFFDPSEVGLNYTSFPLHSLDLRNLSVTYCQDYGSHHDDPHPLLTDIRGRVNVSQCCWTYNTALPRTYIEHSSTLRRRDLEDENCPSVDPNLYEEYPTQPPLDQDTFKHVILQCLVTQDTSIPPTPDGEILDFDDVASPLFLNDPPAPPPEGYDEEDPPLRFNSAEGEDYDDDDDDEYDFPRASSTTEAFLALIASLDSSNSQSTTSNWRERRSLVNVVTDSPNTTTSPHPTTTRVPFLLLLFLVTVFFLPALFFSNYESAGKQGEWPSTQSLGVVNPARRKKRRSKLPAESECPEKRRRFGELARRNTSSHGRRRRSERLTDRQQCSISTVQRRNYSVDKLLTEFIKRSRRNSSPEWEACPEELRQSLSPGQEGQSPVWAWPLASLRRRSQSPSTPSTTTINTSSLGRSNEWRRLQWSSRRPSPRSYSLQGIT